MTGIEINRRALLVGGAIVMAAIGFVAGDYRRWEAEATTAPVTPVAETAGNQRYDEGTVDQGAASDNQYNPEPLNMQTVLDQAQSVDAYHFVNDFDRYRGGWVHFTAGALHCAEMRDHSKQCFDRGGRLPIIIGFNEIKTINSDGTVMDKHLSWYGDGCKPTFYFDGITPTANPNVIGVAVDTLYCD